jgi:hypothetical protein
VEKGTQYVRRHHMTFMGQLIQQGLTSALYKALL